MVYLNLHLTASLIVYFTALFTLLAITSVFCCSKSLSIVFDVLFLEQASGNDQSPFGSELGSEMDSEEAYDLREVSSDVEMHPDDLDDVDDVDSDAR